MAEDFPDLADLARMTESIYEQYDALHVTRDRLEHALAHGIVDDEADEAGDFASLARPLGGVSLGAISLLSTLPVPESTWMADDVTAPALPALLAADEKRQQLEFDRRLRSAVPARAGAAAEDARRRERVSAREEGRKQLREFLERRDAERAAAGGARSEETDVEAEVDAVLRAQFLDETPFAASGEEGTEADVREERGADGGRETRVEEGGRGSGGKGGRGGAEESRKEADEGDAAESTSTEREGTGEESLGVREKTAADAAAAAAAVADDDDVSEREDPAEPGVFLSLLLHAMDDMQFDPRDWAPADGVILGEEAAGAVAEAGKRTSAVRRRDAEVRSTADATRPPHRDDARRPRDDSRSSAAALAAFLVGADAGEEAEEAEEEEEEEAKGRDGRESDGREGGVREVPRLPTSLPADTTAVDGVDPASPGTWLSKLGSASSSASSFAHESEGKGAQKTHADDDDDDDNDDEVEVEAEDRARGARGLASLRAEALRTERIGDSSSLFSDGVAPTQTSASSSASSASSFSSTSLPSSASSSGESLGPFTPSTEAQAPEFDAALDWSAGAGGHGGGGLDADAELELTASLRMLERWVEEDAGRVGRDETVEADEDGSGEEDEDVDGVDAGDDEDEDEEEVEDDEEVEGEDEEAEEDELEEDEEEDGTEDDEGVVEGKR